MNYHSQDNLDFSWGKLVRGSHYRAKPVKLYNNNIYNIHIKKVFLGKHIIEI